MQAPTGYEAPPSTPRKSSSTLIWIIVAVCAVCGCGGVGILAAVLVPVFMQARNAAGRAMCLSNVKQLAMAQMLYSSDNDDERFPAAQKWVDLTAKYAKGDPFNCPTVLRQRGEYGYAMNSTLSNKKSAEVAVPNDTVVVFETGTQARNASSDPKMDAPPNRHGPGRNEGYCDGHAKWLRSGSSTSGSP